MPAKNPTNAPKRLKLRRETVKDLAVNKTVKGGVANTGATVCRLCLTKECRTAVC